MDQALDDMDPALDDMGQTLDDVDPVYHQRHHDEVKDDNYKDDD